MKKLTPEQKLRKQERARELLQEKRARTTPGYPVPARNFSLEEIESYFCGDKITCLLCGKTYKSLGNHLSRVHEMSADTYKERYGFIYTRGLDSGSSHDRRRRARHQILEEFSELVRMRTRASDNRKNINHKFSRGFMEVRTSAAKVQGQQKTQGRR